MKLHTSLKLVAAGAIALGVTVSLSESSQACPQGNTDSNCSHRRYPVVTTTPSPVVYPRPGEGNCSPNVGVPCSQRPVPLPQRPVGNCQPGGIPCGQAQPPTVSHPNPSNSFFCNSDRQGRPTTFASTQSGAVPIIRWVSYHFAESGYDPATRCQEVTGRFNLFSQQGRLNFITTGIVNRLPVVCVASDIGGPCTGVLFTLKPNQSASRVIQQLFDVRVGASGSLYESDSREYIDINRYINEAKAQSGL
ncbi:COP23 domain-containing protein [Kovacikia minuta CCNUW1]|uniref:COP23 domain-containing protein n=1 Tax=Kovacikia minuta TaxID=2931930 RepID=UPI001CC9D4C5|nr:COP23 domain-containing protein [Kovacikia minuta]UBF28389.1 COP23 domain-containing protein [Kovacikia minuta CCNUW1]